MKAILEFNLDDQSDRMEHLRAIKATDAFLALSSFAEELRRLRKYGDGELTEGQQVFLEKLTGLFYESLECRNINLNEDLD